MGSNFKMPICLNMTPMGRLHHGLGWYQQRWKNRPHIVIKGMTTGLCYRDAILDVYVRPYAGEIGPQFVLMDDNARLRHARVVEEYLQQDTIVPMDWRLAFSPDLNPIEHAWNMQQVAILRCPDQTTTLVELENVLIEDGDNIEMTAIQRLIGIMRRHCQTVSASRGSHTSY